MKKFLPKDKHSKSGIAISLTVGFLAVLVLLAIGFAVSARLELLMAKNHLNAVKAGYLAEAGLQRAIAELKEAARSSFAYNDNVSIGGEHVLGEGAYTGSIVDCASMINLNDGNPNLQAMLTTLNANLGYPLNPGDIINIVSHAPYETKKQLLSVAGIGKSKYDVIKNFVTVHSYKDPNCDYRSPININTAHFYVLRAVLFNLSDGLTVISNWDSSRLASAIIRDVSNNGPYKHSSEDRDNGWRRFEDLVNNTLGSSYKTEIIVNNCNPNRDKSSLTNSTTELIFSSGGHYSISSAGTVRKAGVDLAERRLQTIVKIYDIWNQTTEEQFACDDPLEERVARVTWKDSCPINYDSLKTYKYDPDNAITIPNALKIGFWDDFPEDWNEWSSPVYSSKIWNVMGGTYEIAGGELRTRKADWPQVVLGGNSGGTYTDKYWYFADFSARAYIRDIDNIGEPTVPRGWNRQFLDKPPPPNEDDWCRGDGDYNGYIQAGAETRVRGPIYQKYMNTGQLLFRRRGTQNEAAVYMSYPQTEVGWTDVGCFSYFKPEGGTTLKNKLVLAHRADLGTAECNWVDSRTIQLLVKGSTATANAYWDGGSASVTHTWAGFNDIPSTGFFALFASWVVPQSGNLGCAFDNVRVIPTHARYISIEKSDVGTIEQGTVSGTVTLLDNAAADTRVDLSFETPGSSASIKYQADFYSMDANIEDTPVLEDVWVTYLGPTETLYYTELSG